MAVNCSCYVCAGNTLIIMNVSNQSCMIISYLVFQSTAVNTELVNISGTQVRGGS
jgi:hypothetical protein